MDTTPATPRSDVAAPRHGDQPSQRLGTERLAGVWLATGNRPGIPATKRLRSVIENANLSHYQFSLKRFRGFFCIAINKEIDGNSRPASSGRQKEMRSASLKTCGFLS